jgi:3-dehydroquinate synthase
LKVHHRLGSYEVHFALLAEAGEHIPADTYIITDENVWRAYSEAFYASNRVIVLPAGEQSKSVATFEQCLEQLAEMGAHRGSTVTALGGGVVGDLAGFVAAAYMRGIAYIQVPTTLLAQVDSSVGGKVAIDLRAGKNLAGAFYPPSKVIICSEMLRTLDSRQMRNGLAEMWKYAFIADAALVAPLAQLADCPQPEQLSDLIKACVAIKAAIVQEDEFETTGRRAILNFGHTIGHAIEHAGMYSEWLHGEAISIGMVAEARLGEALQVTPQGTAKEVARHLGAAGLPTELPPIPMDTLLDIMMRDKKRTSDGLAFSLLTRIGECKLVNGVRNMAVSEALQSDEKY